MSLRIDPGPRAFRVPKTAELVASQLRNKIIRNELPDGHLLPNENELVAEYSISRPTLREAIRILESEGLVTVARGVHGGPRVHKPNPRLAAQHFGRVLQNRGTTLGDIFTARLLLEPICARFLAERGGKAAVKRLHELLDDCRRNIDNAAAFSVATTRFHNTIIELSGNAPLILLMGTLNHIFELHISSTTIASALSQAAATSNQVALEMATRLLDRIEARDGDGAESVAREFLGRVDKQMRKLHDVNQVIDVLE
jgi:GntR family transcriptional regulator, transcriptional repressor for pyruvate dehydrogenase complex